MKRVLYVCADGARWMRFNKGELVDALEESVSFDKPIPYKPSHAINSISNDVHLLVDCEQTEIDIHPLLQLGASWRNQSNNSALKNKLASQFPDAIVRSAPKKTLLNAVFVQHINIPPAIRRWLAHVERSAITVCSISTVDEVVAERWGSIEDSLVITASSKFLRHTFCQSGHAVFTRAVGLAHETNFVSELTQTLAHLKSTGLIQQAVQAYFVGVPDRLVSDFPSIELISHSTVVPIESDTTEIFLAQQLLSAKFLQTNSRYRHVSHMLQKFLQRRARKKQIGHRVLFGVLVVLSLGFTALNEWQRVNEHREFTARKTELRMAIAMNQEEAVELSPQAAVMSGALLEKISIESAQGISPAILLTILGDVFTQYRKLELQELSWAVSSLEPSSSDAAANQTIVNLAGSIFLGESLRDQQQVFNEFTTYLEKFSELSHLVVLQTPLMQFNGSSSIDPSELIGNPKFRLQFNLNRYLGNET